MIFCFAWYASFSITCLCLLLDMKCTFTYSWRDGFVRRHRHRLPPHIIKLLSPKVQRDDDIDSDLDILDNNYGLPGEGPMKEPSVWKQKPKLSTQERALKETKKAFTKAGLSKEEVLELLIKLKVPGRVYELPSSETYPTPNTWANHAVAQNNSCLT